MASTSGAAGRPRPFADYQPTENRRTSVVNSVAHRLLEELTAGDFAPGTRLPAERELAATLRVPRSTLREAMAALDILGIVQIRAGSGTYLAADSANLLPQALKWGLMLRQPRTQELIEVREILEVSAARLAAARASKRDIDRLETYLDRMRNADGNVEQFVEADVGFHLETAAIAGNAVLSDILGSLRSLLQAWFDRTLRIDGTMAATLLEHERVFDAIKERSPDGAEAAMRDLMDEADVRLRRSLTPPPDDGSPPDVS